MRSARRATRTPTRLRLGCLAAASLLLCAGSDRGIQLVRDELPGFREVEPVANPDMSYDRAYRHKAIKFELRHAIRPIPSDIREKYPRYRSHGILSQETGEIVARFDGIAPGPENYFASEFATVVANVANDGGRYVETRPLPAHLAHGTFHADFVRFTRIQPRSRFGAGFREIRVIAMHKVGRGSLYVFQLYDDRAAAEKLLSQTFAALRFHPEP